jgi:hypothetical protein
MNYSYIFIFSSLFLHLAWLCADGVGMACSVQNTGTLQKKYVCSQHFSVTDSQQQFHLSVHQVMSSSIAAAVNIQGK